MSRPTKNPRVSGSRVQLDLDRPKEHAGQDFKKLKELNDRAKQDDKKPEKDKDK